MGLPEDGEVGKLPAGDLRLGQTTGPISSLNEAWSRMRRQHTPERRHSSPDAELLWRSDARGFLGAQGSWRSACCRYC